MLNGRRSFAAAVIQHFVVVGGATIEFNVESTNREGVITYTAPIHYRGGVNMFP